MFRWFFVLNIVPEIRSRERRGGDARVSVMTDGDSERHFR